MSNFKSLIIVSHGRTGSTLLQGILNTAPGFLIRGENFSFLDGFYLAYSRLERAQQQPFTVKANSPTHPFYGVREFDLDRVLAELSRVVRDMLVPPEHRDTTVCYGFKEIRYPLAEPRFTEYMTFLRKLMPDLAIILNTRAHESLARSGWWSKRPAEEVAQKLSESDAVRRDYVAQNPDHAFHVRYEDVCVQGPELQALFEFLGAEYAQDRVAATLAMPHSTTKKKKKPDQPARQKRRQRAAAVDEE
jgi:hypothetical protein